MIARGRLINLNGNSVWVNLKDEKLPRMCFKCGRILHGELGCDAGAFKLEVEQVANS